VDQELVKLGHGEKEQEKLLYGRQNLSRNQNKLIHQNRQKKKDCAWYTLFCLAQNEILDISGGK
jgi:hypothetical protein